MRRALSTLLTLVLLVGALGGAGYLLLGGRLPASLDDLRTLPDVLREPVGAASPDPVQDPDPAEAPASGSDPVLTPPVRTGGSQTDSPTPGYQAKKAPLGRPAPLQQTSGSYAFIRKQRDGSPVAYDPCRPIHYVVRSDQAPPGADRLVREAVARVSAATGLRFVADGGTTELPDRNREVFQPERYGDRWAPVLIAWRTAGQYPPLAGDTVGEGGSVAISVQGRPTVFVSGQVVLDSRDLRRMMRTAAGRAEARGVLMHELGHVVGLDHVKDRTQLMYRSTVDGVTDFGAGDLTGLAALGRGACAPWL